MKLIILLFSSYFVCAADSSKSNLACQSAYDKALDCVAKVNSKNDPYKEEALSLQIKCNQQLSLCVQECKKTPKDPVAMIQLKACSPNGEISADVNSAVNNMKKQEEQLNGGLQNPASKTIGVDVGNAAGDEKSGVVKIVVPTNVNNKPAPKPIPTPAPSPLGTGSSGGTSGSR